MNLLGFCRFLPFLILLIPSLAQADISGSPHDFSATAWNRGAKVCFGCHAALSSDTSQETPLWNRETTSTSYTVYTSVTMDAAVGQPDGVSKVCLSCHDGTIAVDNFGGIKDGTSYLQGVSLGSDLSDDHPVSFVYDSRLARADKGLFDPVSTPSGLGATIDHDLLEENKVQCTSCHSMHNKSGQPNLLIMSNRRSNLCLTCHNK